MRSYEIRRAGGAVPLGGAIEGTPWAQAAALEIAEFPWYAAGAKQATTVRLLWDDAALYVQFVCEDRHIFAQVTERNGPVCEDSCVELFAMPQPDRQANYFNLELNCCGVFLLGWGPGRGGRRRVTHELAQRFQVATSVPGPTKAEAEDDDGWWAAAALPFEVLGAFTSLRLAPAAGDVWRANLYRCGGATEPQFACWNPIEAAQPDFHRPEYFGELRFV